MKIKIFIIILFLTGLSFAQKTWQVDTVSQKVKVKLSSTGNYIHFFTGSTSRIRQVNDSTFVNIYANSTPYIFNIYSVTKDSSLIKVSLYRNNALFSQFNKNSDSLSNTLTYSNLISLNVNDTVRFFTAMVGSPTDSLLTFKLNILRFP